VTAILLALAASVGWGVSDFLGGLKSRALPLLTVQIVSLLAGFVVTLPALALHGEGPPRAWSLVYGLLSGALGAVGIAAFYRGLAIGAMGIVAPISATAPVVPVVIGLTRGEQPAVVQLAGIALALIGIVLVGQEPGEETRRFALGAGLALLAAGCFGVALFGISEASKGDPYWGALALRVGSVVAVGVAALVFRPSLAGAARSWLALAAIGTLDAAATLLYSVATTRGLLSVVVVLASLYPVTIVLLARAVLSERLASLQLAGAAAALTGAALISAG
jgi:drug/metabolite transporter (DMT)-like permease